MGFAQSFQQLIVNPAKSAVTENTKNISSRGSWLYEFDYTIRICQVLGLRSEIADIHHEPVRRKTFVFG